ncbi:hypothetical protein Tco_0596151 [Tanacetum coccineum]
MSDVERVDTGSQAEASSSSKRDMGSYTSTMKPSDVKALTRKYKIPMDLHPVVVSSEWAIDCLTDEYIGLYEQYFEFAGLRVPFSTFLLAVIRHFHVHISQLVPLAIPDAMCWRHHDSDISDPAPKDGFDEADVIALTHQSIDIRGIPSGLLFSAGLAITWEFPKFRPLFKDPEGHVVTMSEYLRLPFLSGMTIEAGEALTEQNVIPQHTTTPLSADEQVPEKTDSQQRVEASDPKIVATRIRKANAAAKRKADKNRESEGAGGSKGSSKRRKPSSGPGEGDKEKSSDQIPCPTPLRTVVVVTSDVSRGDNAVSPTQTQRDNLVEILAHTSANTITRPYEEHHDEHSGFLERVVIETKSVPTAATRPDDGKSTAHEETPMPDPPPKGGVSQVLVPMGPGLPYLHLYTQTQRDNLVEIPAHDSANTITRPYEEHHNEHSGVLGNRDGNFDDDVDGEIDIGDPGGHASDTLERVVIETESVPTAATRPDDGKSTAHEETPMPDPPPKGVGADGVGSSSPPSLFVLTWGIHQRSRVTTPEECRDLMVNLIPPGVREEMNLLDNNVVLDRAWFSLARGAMAQAHALCQFESLYDTHHALQESHETMRGQLVRTREDFNVVQNFYNTLSERHRKLREEHARCSEGLVVVQSEKDILTASNAEQALRIKELEQKLKSVDEVHSSAVKDLESQLAQKDSALVYAERISGERLSKNEGLRAQLAFAQKEKTDAIRKLLPTVVERLLQSHEYKQSLSVPFNFALQTGWGKGLAEGRSEKELHKIMMRMNGFDPYSDKKMTAEYERLFSKTYSHVDRISHLFEKPVQDLLKLHPTPPPRDAPKAGFRGIAFAPEFIRAAKVANSKDTASKGFSRSKTGPSPQDPASTHVFGGSKAPPSRKT